jgi:3-oxoacyl-(acyl-carrier-protein) synthase/SAM-dependent methyltransferase
VSDPVLSPVQEAIATIRTMRTRLQASERRATAPVAIIGMSCRFPGADGLDEYWQLLSKGVDAVGDIPPDRWDANAWYDPDPDAPGKMSTHRGGFVRDVADFDAEFFGISDREAVSIDPQHRLLLEVGWEALEDAGLTKDALFGSKTGVFIGISSFDYATLRGRADDLPLLDAYHGTGVSHAAAAGRLAYYLGLRGPAIAIDTACSSSLVAVHLACQHLRLGDCAAALVGGVNLILSPDIHVALSKARMMAADGRCKAFDAAADGFVRSEGCGVLVLKLLDDALRDGDRVRAVIRGSACNQDGRSSGLSAPNGPAQTAVVTAAWHAAGVRSEDIRYVEAHGTGTALGDPIEAGALAAAIENAPRDKPLAIGSVKTNIGHLEAAAGVAGMIKTVLALENEMLPASLHCRNPSPTIDWPASGLEVLSDPVHWPRLSTPRLAGVSSFGFSGTNAHIVLEEAPCPPMVTESAVSCRIVTLSAASEATLCRAAERLAAFLAELGPEPSSWADVTHTANARRSHLSHRAAVVADTPMEAARAFAALARAESHPGLAHGRADPMYPHAVDPSAWALGGDDEQPARRQQKLLALAALFVRGARIDWSAVEGARSGRAADLPRRVWSRRRYWFDSTTPTRDAPSSEATWQRVVAATERQADQIPVDLLLHTYPEKYRMLDVLARAYILRALTELSGGARPDAALTGDVLVRSFGVLPLYRDLMEIWLRKLADAAFLPTSSVAAIEADAEPIFADAPVLLDYVKRCGALLTPILKGESSALDTLFPGGDSGMAEEIYHRLALSRYFNAIVAEAASSFIAGRPGMARIIEVGGGTGGVTGSILSRLPSGRASYTFTDVSRFFLDAAARRFAPFQHLDFAILDLEQSPALQGFKPGSYDLVVAANVLHATVDLRRTIDFVRLLLAPGGALLLYEVTDPPAYFDVSIALVEGWWTFSDDVREASPLLNTEQWMALLPRHGFDRVGAWPARASPTDVLGSRVFLARAEGAVTPSVAAAGPAAETAPPWMAQMAGKDQVADDIRAVLDRLPDSEHGQALIEYVRRTVARVLRRPDTSQIAGDQRLMDLGLDSLMAVELRNDLSRDLRLAQNLPATLMFDHPSIVDIARFLHGRMHGPVTPQPESDPLATPPSRITAARIAAMSDADVEQRLREKLGNRSQDHDETRIGRPV